MMLVRSVKKGADHPKKCQFRLRHLLLTSMLGLILSAARNPKYQKNVKKIFSDTNFKVISRL